MVCEQLKKSIPAVMTMMMMMAMNTSMMWLLKLNVS